MHSDMLTCAPKSSRLMTISESKCDTCFTKEVIKLSQSGLRVTILSCVGIAHCLRLATRHLKMHDGKCHCVRAVDYKLKIDLHRYVHGWCQPSRHRIARSILLHSC